MKKITEFKSLIGHFIVVKFEYNNEVVYGAVNVENITDGKLNKELNGFELHVHKELNEVINELQTLTKIHSIMRNENIDMMAALKIYMEENEI